MESGQKFTQLSPQNRGKNWKYFMGLSSHEKNKDQKSHAIVILTHINGNFMHLFNK